MDVLLINPNERLSVLEDSLKVPPLGLAYIAAILEENKYQVKIVDLTVENVEDEILINQIKRFEPKIIGLTCMTPFVSRVKELAEKLKRDFEVIIVVGGPHATALPENLINNEYIDFVIYAEGEYSFLKLADSIIRKRIPIEQVQGIIYKRNKEFIKAKSIPYIKNLDSLPFPARHLLPMDKYSLPHSNAEKITSILTTRGCPYNCVYCDYKFLMGDKIRTTSPKRVVDEIEYCLKNFSIDYFNFRDSTFTLNENRVHKICNEIIKRKLNIRWDCTARTNLVTQRMLNEMKKAGCELVSFGIESGSQKILDWANKKITLEQSYNAVKMAKRAKLNTLCYFVLGLPPETKETAKKTIKFAIKLNPDYASFGLVTPFPGTPLFDYAINKNLIKFDKNQDYIFKSLFNDPILLTKNFTKKELVNTLRWAYLRFYFRLGYILKKLSKIRSVGDFKKNVNGLIMLLNQVENS